MGSVQAFSRHATSHARSQISSAGAASDREDLVSHAQAQGSIETTIRADAVEIPHEQHQQQQGWYEGQGIMKTVDVSRTVSSYPV